MKPNPSSETKEFYKGLSLVFLTITATFLICLFLSSHQFKRMFMTDVERYEDTSASFAARNKPPVQEDSIKLAHSKVAASVFKSEYSAESWYAKYNANKVAFDDEFDRKQIDLYGTIKSISNSWAGYSLIYLEPGEGIYGDIICNNVVGDKDVWRKEVKAVAIGDAVHIRGIFWRSPFQSDDFNLEHCHIIIDSLTNH
jgi:hypothetical protein